MEQPGFGPGSLTFIYQEIGGACGKESTCSAGDVRDEGSIPGSGRSPGRGHGNPLQYFLPGESQGRRGLVGCRLWGRTESDTTEVI